MTVSHTTPLLSTLDRIRTECLTTVSYSDASRSARMELLVATEWALGILGCGATVDRNPDGSTIIQVRHNTPVVITPRAMLCSCGFDGICGHRLIAANTTDPEDLPTDFPGEDDPDRGPRATVGAFGDDPFAECPGCGAVRAVGERCWCAADAAANAHMHAVVGFDLDDDDAYTEALHIAATGGL